MAFASLSKGTVGLLEKTDRLRVLGRVHLSGDATLQIEFDPHTEGRYLLDRPGKYLFLDLGHRRSLFHRFLGLHGVDILSNT
jgi:hypothetical protein